MDIYAAARCAASVLGAPEQQMRDAIAGHLVKNVREFSGQQPRLKAAITVLAEKRGSNELSELCKSRDLVTVSPPLEPETCYILTPRRGISLRIKAQGHISIKDGKGQKVVRIAVETSKVRVAGRRQLNIASYRFSGSRPAFRG